MLAAGALSWGPAEAWAYCRSTTCTKGCEVDDDGCKTQGLKLWWAGGCVGISLQKGGTAQLPFGEVSDALDGALGAWSALPCGEGAATVSFARLQNVECDRTELNAGPNANVVIFRDNDWRYSGVGNTLGFTTVSFAVATGEILGADIEVNGAYNELTAGEARVVYDLRSILTHELGHLLGLAHSPDPEATMSSDYEQGSIEPRSLSPDDVAAVCEAYPPGRQAACDPAPRNGFASSCAPPPEPADEGGCAVGSPRSSLGGAGALLGLAGALRARRRWAAVLRAKSGV